MTNQDLWNEKVTIHNMEYKYESIDTLPVEEIKVPIKETPVPEKDKIKKKKKPEVKTEEVIKEIKKLMYCLPGIIETKKDPLYGDIKSTTTYGEKFTFEGIIASENALDFDFWTNIKINPGSIVYVDKKWWKVSAFEEKAGGFSHHCIISDSQFSFE